MKGKQDVQIKTENNKNALVKLLNFVKVIDQQNIIKPKFLPACTRSQKQTNGFLENSPPETFSIGEISTITQLIKNSQKKKRLIKVTSQLNL